MEDGRTYIFLDTIEEVAAFLTVLSDKGASAICDKRNGVWRLEVHQTDTKSFHKILDSVEAHIKNLSMRISAEYNSAEGNEETLYRTVIAGLADITKKIRGVRENANKKED